MMVFFHCWDFGQTDESVQRVLIDWKFNSDTVTGNNLLQLKDKLVILDFLTVTLTNLMKVLTKAELN